MSIDEIHQRYLRAGAFGRDPDAVAALFTEDGIYETPLVPDRLTGRDAIRAGIGVYQRDPGGTINIPQTRYQLHQSTDPEVFVAEMDVALDTPAGPRTMSLVQIFRLRDGLIAHLRDYF
ncbi:nuclear transport factor 2 family protein [Actinoplanes sp. NPDC049265]|uniref:nuclear transport factor 2 family protein n=1 Tax=Actinoplanes sp. NPDC049265 TaxID=3363902 RepID=UPI00371CCCBD